MGLFGKKNKEDNTSNSGTSIFNKGTDNNTPVFSISDYTNNQTATNQHSGGVVNLSKNSTINLGKTQQVIAKASWLSKTDYDLYALVLLKDGRELVVSTFGSQEQKTPTDSVLNGAVKHNGDIGRVGGDSGETIVIKMTPEIAAVIPVAYSAQSNGTGSFKQYKVSMEIDNGSNKVVIDADHANDNNRIYTVVIGAIINNGDGTVTIKNIEEYSAPNSENRPTFLNGDLFMDKGARNLYK